jgi:glycine cleavage system H lipoate-binding protein
VGIEAGLAGLLPQPTTVVLPVPQVALHRGQPCVWLTNTEELFRLRAPVDGTVCAIHDKISEKWQLLRDDPYSAGWLYEFSATSERLESARLMNVSEAMQEYSQDARKFKALIAQAASALNRNQTVMLQDGGELGPHAEEIIDKKSYLSIVHEVFGI